MTPDRFVPLNTPDLGETERLAILDAYATGWVTSGKFVDEFESRFAELCHRRFAIACSSGTMALYIALSALGVKPGQRVLMPAYTCAAAAHAAVVVTGKPPLCGDVDPETWGLCARPTPDENARWEAEGRLWPFMALLGRAELGAVILAHTYGVPARDTLEIERACRERGMPMIEDASEAHGAAIGARPVGSFGIVSALSCRGEKTISGGELGVVLTDDAAIAQRARQWTHNGIPAPEVRFWLTVPALNAQPSHLNCALACAQLGRLDELVGLRKKVHHGWARRLREIPGITFQGEHGHPAWWLTAILIDRRFTAMVPQDLMTALRARGIETRPGFYPVPDLPHLRDPENPPCPVADDLLRRMLIVPSGPRITGEDQDYVVDQIMEIVGR